MVAHRSPVRYDRDNISRKGDLFMLPCQDTCPSYREGCHKSCPHWKEFQARQRLERRAKKEYLAFYNQLCTAVTRQFAALSPRRCNW